MDVLTFKRASIASAVFLLLCSVGRAAEYSWNVAVGDWSLATNWVGAVPTANDDAWITNGGTATVTQMGETCLDLYLDDASSVQMTSGNFALGGGVFVGNFSGATFNQSGGTIAGYLNLGWNTGSYGTYNLNGSGDIVGGLVVGYSGTGVFNQSGGTNAAGTSLGYNSGSVGTYNLSGSGYLSGGVTLGYGGTGRFTQTGGTNAGEIDLGGYSGAVGTYNLSGSGYLSGDVFVGIAGVGVFNQSGGTVNCLNMDLGDSIGFGSYGLGTYTLSDGVILGTELNEVIGASGTGNFLQTGGVNNAWSLLLGDGSAAVATYSLNGGTLSSQEILSLGGISRFYFNGGLIEAGGYYGDFMFGFTQAYVQSGGARIYTDAQTCIIAQSLLDGGGGGGLTKYGSGTLTLTGTNTYTGGTTINAGVLSFANLSLGTTGSITLADGATLQWQPGNSEDISARLVLGGSGAWGTLDTNGNNVTFASAIGGAGGVVKIGAGSLTFAQSNSYAGGTNVSGGVLVANAVQAFGLGPVTVSGGTLTVNFAQSVSSVTLNSGALNVNDPGSLGSGPITIAGSTLDNTSSAAITLSTNNTEFWTGNFTFNGTQNLNMGTGPVVLQAPCAVTVNGGTLTVGGAISGPGFGMTKTGPGTLTLAATNSYSGGTNIINGTLQLAASNSLATGGAITVSGGTLDLGGLGQTTSGPISLLGGTVQNGTLTGTGANFAVHSGAVSAALAGPVGLVKSTGGYVVLSGSNSYAGGTMVNGGYLQIANGQALGANNALTVNGGVLDLAGNSVSVSGLSGTGGNVTTSSGATTLTMNVASGSSTYTGTLSGAVGITKTGSGAETLSGANTYTGATSVTGGLLVLQGQNQSSSLSVGAGGEIELAGATLTLNFGSLIAQSGGTVAYNGTTVNGGYLRGPGTQTTLPGGTSSFNGVTTYNSTVFLQNGPTTLANFSNGGQITNNASLNWSGGGNTITGSLAVGSTVNVVDWGNQGVLTINKGGVLNNAVSDIVFGGGSETTISPGGRLNANSDGSGSAIDVRGALLANSGTIAGATNVYFGSTVQGGGIYGAVNVYNGGEFSPGANFGSVATGALSNSGEIVVGNATSLIVQSGTGTAMQTAGTLELGASAALSAGTVQINGGTFQADSTTALITASLVYDSPTASTYAGHLAGVGNMLTVDNPAAVLVLSGSNTYGGGTDVLAGTLIVDSNKALLSGTSLEVGAAAESVFGTVAGAVPTAESHGLGVPEPSTLALLGLGAIGLFGYARRPRKGRGLW